MALEIERKFLVNKNKWTGVVKGEGRLILQGYLCIEKEKSIRVRLSDDKAILTIKGALTGAARTEFEYPIPTGDAKYFLEHFASCPIKKTRYRIHMNNKLWEVDEFLEDNEGLILAEIELANEQEIVELPDWMEREVTEDPMYYNVNLGRHPYKSWV